MSRALADEVIAARAAVALFFADGRSARGILEVSGGDAQRWLDGMLSNDVTAIAAESPRSGCYATLLTPKGGIVADLHVLARRDGYWLETDSEVVPELIARLERYIVADDVKLSDRSAAIDRLGLEGPLAVSVLAQAAGSDRVALAAVRDSSWCALEVAGVAVSAARFGWSGEDAFQLFLPAGSRERVVEALVTAADGSLILASRGALEVLRIEAGVPRLGAELDEDVFPDEARLEAAISRSKGCYTGQEIVARLYSRGAVNHLLVGLRFEGGSLPEPEAELSVGERRTGEVTSVCLSPAAGAIGLGYVRREHSEPGTEVIAGAIAARVAELPFVSPAASAAIPTG